MKSTHKLTQQILFCYETEGTPTNMFKYIDTIHHWITDPNTAFYNILDVNKNGDFKISSFELDFISDQFAWAPYCKKDILIIKNWMKNACVEQLDTKKYLLFAMDG